jgi:hypothetical protein
MIDRQQAEELIGKNVKCVRKDNVYSCRFGSLVKVSETSLVLERYGKKEIIDLAEIVSLQEVGA